MLEQMQGKSTKESKALVLPFSASSKERTLPFTVEMEMATIFIIAESDRKKGEGLILKKPAEELIFIRKSCYPIWLVPWNDRTLIFDGLGVSAHTMQYEVLPDIKPFVNDVQGSAATRQAYSAALLDHLHYFDAVRYVEEKAVLGLVTNLGFLQDFQQFLKEGEESEESEIKEVCMPPNIDESSISASLKELSDLKATLELEIRSLRDAMRLLSSTTKQHTSAIREEAREVQADLDKRIAEAKTVSMEKIRVIQEKYDARILKASQRSEKQLQDLHQERVKLEKAQERAIGKIERCDSEIQDAKARRDAKGERRWKDERETWKREASTLRKSLEALDKQIEDAESQKKIEIANIRAEFDAQSEEAMKEVRELEATKESKTQLSRKEIKALDDSTSTILGQLDVLTKKKRGSLEDLGKTGMREQRRKTALVYVQFYLSCLRSEGKRKFRVYAPSIAGTMKTTTRLKGMLGMSKLGSLFPPRSKAIADVLDQVITLAERDPVFEKELYDAGVQTNVLKTMESRERILKGLNDLRKEEWVSVNEVQTLSGQLKA